MNLGTHLLESTRVSFDNGVTRGTGWIRGITTNHQPVIGVTYIIELEEDNINKKVYPYSCLGVFECYITGILNIPIAEKSPLLNKQGEWVSCFEKI